MNKDNFVDGRHYEIFHQEIKRIKDDERNEIFIKHHNENYNKQFPFWVVVELMSFGCLSRGLDHISQNKNTQGAS
ncbi:Abi family protein [Virgibacillus sp. DJP39]|uniref:Abi family protein n=1 Tax=Virgibacillus sp. DJP39 TaxID=3409790 RepID=UPI003BB4A8EC